MLGPLLYIIYVNDLPLHVDNHIYLFADDTNSYTMGVRDSPDIYTPEARGCIYQANHECA